MIQQKLEQAVMARLRVRYCRRLIFALLVELSRLPPELRRSTASWLQEKLAEQIDDRSRIPDQRRAA